MVTVKVYDPGARLEMVVVVPDPDVVTPPGLRINVQVPVAGKPFKTTLPVATEHVVWVIGPTAGAVGVGEITTEVVAVAIPQPPEAAIV